MRQTSLAHAKAHLSELVDEAQHRGRRILIRKRGKPAAMIVPVSVGMPAREKPRPMSRAEIDALFTELHAAQGDTDLSAVDDLIEGRR